MEYATKETLTRSGAGPAGLPEDDVELPGLGWVRVRGLNRGELLHSGRLGESKGQQDMERYVLSCALVAPTVTVEDVAAWQESGPGLECQPVLHKINELSGIGKGAAKSDVRSDGDEPGPGV